MSISIKELVKDGKIATFQHYRKGNLYYKTECGFEFPVPINDVGDASLNHTEKAMLLMRFIRKYLESLKEENPA